MTGYKTISKVISLMKEAQWLAEHSYYDVTELPMHKAKDILDHFLNDNSSKEVAFKGELP